jgi:hypothetical protein
LANASILAALAACSTVDVSSRNRSDTTCTVCRPPLPPLARRGEWHTVMASACVRWAISSPPAASRARPRRGALPPWTFARALPRLHKYGLPLGPNATRNGPTPQLCPRHTDKNVLIPCLKCGEWPKPFPSLLIHLGYG